jgi:hypothetical protein
MRKTAAMSLLLALSLAGCGDSKPSAPGAPASGAPSGATPAGFASRGTASLTGADVEKFLVLYPDIKKSKKPEEHMAAAAAHGLTFPDAMLLMSRVTSAYIALQPTGGAMPIKAPAADVDTVRPYEARIKAVMR